MNVIIRPDWRGIKLTKDIRLGDCVVSDSYPTLAEKIVPTERQIEFCFMLAITAGQPVIDKFGPVKWTSWLRSFDLNLAVRGVSSSGHLTGGDGDFFVLNGKTREAYNWLKDERGWEGEIFYYLKRGHCHVGIPRIGVQIDQSEVDK